MARHSENIRLDDLLMHSEFCFITFFLCFCVKQWLCSQCGNTHPYLATFSS